jgi:hypothetical protein
MEVSSRRHTASARLACIGLIAAIACALLVATGAQAATVTIGSPLAGSFFPSTFSTTGTVVNSALPEAGANLTSPVTGTIVRWRIMDGSGGPYRLRVLTPGSGTTYTGAAASDPQTPSGPGIETFAANMPIQAGQTIGLDNTSPTDGIGNSSFGGAVSMYWVPSLGLGETRASTGSSGNELSFNADVLVPVPVIASISPASGSIAGGTQVTIAGHDFTGASAVKFGDTPAAGYSVNSDTQMTATAPSSSVLGGVDVSVTTPGGQTTAGPADRFTYTACVVPKLKGKSLKAARKALTKADCKLGKVKGHKSKTARVKKQNPKPDTVLPPGGKVNVKLGG